MLYKGKDAIPTKSTIKIKAGVSRRQTPPYRAHLKDATASTMSRLCFFSQSIVLAKKVKVTRERAAELYAMYKRKVTVLRHVAQDIKRTVVGKRPAHHQLFNVHFFMKSSTF